MKIPKLNGEKIALVIGKGGGHYYRVGNNPEVYPSVTTVMGAVLAKPALVPWAKKMATERIRSVLKAIKFDGEYNPINLDTGSLDETWVDHVIDEAKKLPDEIKEKAADVGTRAHALISEMLKGQRDFSLEGIDGDVYNAVAAFLEWYPKSGIKIYLSEICVASHKIKTGGSVDALAKTKDGKPMIIDFKTSSATYADFAYQLGGYALCYEEMTGDSIDTGAIIRFSKKAFDKNPFEVSYVSDMGMAKMGFGAAKILYDISKANILGLKQWEPSSKKVAKKEKVA